MLRPPRVDPTDSSRSPAARTPIWRRPTGPWRRIGQSAGAGAANWTVTPERAGPVSRAVPPVGASGAVVAGAVAVPGVVAAGAPAPEMLAT